MKKTYIFLFAVLFNAQLYAQSLQFVDSLGNNLNGQVITITSNDPNENFVADVSAKNIDSVSINVKAKRYELNVVNGTANYFCWYQCLAPTNSGVYPFREDLGSITINSNQTRNKQLNAHHNANGIVGLAKYRYVIYNAANVNDSAYVDIFFDIALSVSESNISSTQLSVYPNPASKRISLDYSISNFASNDESKFVIRDMLGEIVKEVPVKDSFGKMNMNIEGLKSGIYFYSLVVNNRAVLSKRLIIK